jgi:hypothetical protein
MKSLSFPKVKGGRVTNCIFTPTGAIRDLKICLDSGVTEVEFLDESITIAYDGSIHLNSVAGTDAK